MMNIIARKLWKKPLLSLPLSKTFSTEAKFTFNPTNYGLNPDFLLTNFSDLKGCGCKVPQDKLVEYLRLIGDGSVGIDTPDCSTIPIPGTDTVMVSTTDFFYPLVDDPYNQGKIACCNVLSDLYCMGITRVDTVLMILGVSTKMTEKEKDVTNSLLIKGFNEKAQEAGTAITGGQTVYNPWVMIGGTAMSVLREEEIIRPNNIKPGEVLIMTKPLGMQLVVNFNQWLKLKNDKWKKVESLVSEQEVLDAYEKGIKAMSTLNLTAAKLMKKYKSGGGTDVTGFGIKGHSQNLARAQLEKVDLVINKFPTVGPLYKFDKIARDFKFKEGKAAETSGGILLSLAKEKVQDFLGEFKEISGSDAYVVGEVVKGQNNSIIVDDLEFIEV